MQHRILRGVVLSFAVVIMAVGSLTLLSCSSDDEETRTFTATVPLNSTSANNNSTAVLNGKTVVVSGNELAADTPAPALKAALASQSPTLSFSGITGANGNFTTANPTTSGTVRFGSCIFTVTAPANLAGTITVQNCSYTVTGTADLGGVTTTGTLTLTLNNTTSTTAPVQVQLDDNGVIILDGISTVITATGSSGS